MKELLLVFTLCGTPHYIVMQDSLGYAAGSPSEAPQIISERLRAIVDKDGSIIGSIPLEGLTGLRCS